MASQIKLFLVSNLTIVPIDNISQNSLPNEHLKCQCCNKTYKTETELIRIEQNVKEKINHVITTNTIYHLLVMATILQLSKQSNTLGRKRTVPFYQIASAQHTIKLFSTVKLFSFSPHVCVSRDL